LEWIPQSREYIEKDRAGRVIETHPVHGVLALVEDGRSYSAWPVDPKGSHDQGWALTYDNGTEDEDLGQHFISWPDARAFAEQHNNKRLDEPDFNDGLRVPES
jgi:hypothetical protein